MSQIDKYELFGPLPKQVPSPVICDDELEAMFVGIYETVMGEELVADGFGEYHVKGDPDTRVFI